MLTLAPIVTHQSFLLKSPLAWCTVALNSLYDTSARGLFIVGRLLESLRTIAQKMWSKLHHHLRQLAL